MTSLTETILETLYDTLFPLSPQSEWALAQSLEDQLETLPRTAKRALPFPAYVGYSYAHETVRTLVHALKFEGSKRASKRCAELLYEELLQEVEEMCLFSGFENPLLIPLPLSEKRERERGFNQAERLAKELQSLAPSLGILLYGALKRARHTKQQSHLQNRDDRARNVKGAFEVTHPEKIAGRSIILIDDVLTTGATAGECAQVLKRAGAQEVFVVAFAG